MSGDFAPLSGYPRPADVFGRFNRIIDDTDPIIIDGQIAYGLEIEEAGGNFFNNFMHNMPGGMYQTIVSASMIDRPVTTDPTEIHQANPLARSTKSAEVTWREFFADVNGAVDGVGLDRDEIDRLRHAFEVQRSPETALAFTKYVLPVYRLLRIAGYSHGDLYS